MRSTRGEGSKGTQIENHKAPRQPLGHVAKEEDLGARLWKMEEIELMSQTADTEGNHVAVAGES